MSTEWSPELDDFENANGSIVHDEVVQYLRSKTFEKGLKRIVNGSENFEQGLKVVYLSKTAKYKVVDMKDVSPGEVGGGFVEGDDVSVFEIHTHPITRRNSLHACPSAVDLEPSLYNEGPFARAVVVMGSPLQIWVWETPEDNRFVRIAKDWRKSLDRINDPSYSEVDDLFNNLRDSGLKVARGELKKDSLTESLIGLMESTGIKIGH